MSCPAAYIRRPRLATARPDAATGSGDQFHKILLPHYAATVGEVDEALEAGERPPALVQAEVRRAAELQGVEVHAVARPGHAARTLVDYAEEGSLDLVVPGVAGHSSPWGLFLGTASDRVVRHAPCSVLIVC